MRRVIEPLTRRFSKHERGQMLVIFAAIFFVTLGLAAFAIDQGMWLSKRRSAQKDADTSARGGIYALLANPSSAAARKTAAETAGRAVADQNEVPYNANTTFTYNDDTCQTAVLGDWPVPSLHVEINDPTGSLFGRVFGIDGMQDLGAQATACAGEPGETAGIDPFYIAPGADRPEPECFDNQGNPRLGSICALMGPSQFHEEGQRGTIRLQDDPYENPLPNNETLCTEFSNANVRPHVVLGSDAICAVGNEVKTDGGTLQNVDAAVRCRIWGWKESPGADNPDGRGAGHECPGGKPGEKDMRSFEKAPGEGFCDDEFHMAGTTIPPFNGTGLSPAFAAADVVSSPGGVDDFQEVFSDPVTGDPPTSYAGTRFLVPNLCDGRPSPRLVTIILAEEPVGRPPDEKRCIEIDAVGCVKVEQFAMFYVIGCRDVEDSNSVTFIGPIDPLCTRINSNTTALVGVFVKAFIPEGGGVLSGRCDDPGAIGCSIVLVR